MRVPPVGLIPALPPDTRSEVAQLQAALTHGHPTALAAADLTAHTAHLLGNGTLPNELVGALRRYAHERRRSGYPEHWLGDLWTCAPDHSAEEFAARGWDECLTALDRVTAATRTPDPEADPCTATGAGWTAEEALATALLCFLLFPQEPLTAVRRAACTSGDSDSLACLTGAFAGALHGADAWPAAWADRIERRDELPALGRLWDTGA